MSKATSLTLQPKGRQARWLLRGLIVIAIGMPLAHGIAYWQYAHELQSSIDALHAAGEKIEPADFRHSHPQYDWLYSNTENDNSAKDVTAAAAIFDDGSIHATSIDALPTTRPIPAEAWPYLNRAVDWFEPALKRLDRAMSKSHCEWPHSFQSPVQHNLLLPELSQCRGGSELANASAIVEHRRQRDDLVVRRLQETMFLANACEHSPSLGDLCASGIVEMTACRIEQFAPSLRIGDGNNGTASAPDVRGLVAALLDESSATEGLKYQLSTRRMVDVDDCRSLLYEDPFRVVNEYVHGATLDHDALANLEEVTQVLDACVSSADWPTTDAKLANIPDPNCWLLRREYPGNDRRQIQLHYQSLTDRRLAATALAVRLYCADHGRALPATLQMLVPKYLPAIPVDPMAAGGKQLGYLPRKENPILYSVGTNGSDDGGSEAGLPGAYGELGEWRRLDPAFYLSSHRRDYLFLPGPDAHGQIYRPSEPQPAPWDPKPTPHN